MSRGRRPNRQQPIGAIRRQRRQAEGLWRGRKLQRPTFRYKRVPRHACIRIRMMMWSIDFEHGREIP
jgi:hypothetical protein